MATRILVVDDERQLRNLVGEWLTEAGFEVIMAGDGQEGVARLQQHDPALVISDVWMPGMDGYQVCRLTKRLSTAPVLMMTGVPNEAAILKETNVGADDVLLKPFDVGDLLSRVNKLLKEHPGGKLNRAPRPAPPPAPAPQPAAPPPAPERVAAQPASGPHVAVQAQPSSEQPANDQQTQSPEQFLIQVFKALPDIDKDLLLRMAQRLIQR